MPSKKTARSRYWAALGAGLALIVAACSPSETSNDVSAESGNTIVIGTRNIASSLDPAVAADNPAHSYTDAVYETLVGYSSEEEEYGPALAISWESNESSTVYTFDLREDVHFHDGSTMTAEGVIASLKRTADIGKGSAFLLDGVTGYKELGTHQVEFTLEKPDAAFPDKLSQIYIISGQAAMEHPTEDAWFGENSAGSGPYKLENWVPNSELRLVRFEDYWRGWDGEHVDGYHLKVVDAATQVLQLQQGSIDLADSIAFEDVDRVKSEAGSFNVYQNGGLPFYLPFNLSSDKLQNPQVREAISKAIPYEQIADNIMLGFGEQLTGPIPSWMASHNDALEVPAQDIEAARQIMSSQGYDQNNPLTLTLLYFNGLDAERVMATVIQASLKEIGIDLEVQGAPWATLVEQVSDKARRPDMGIMAMSSPTFGPGPLLTSSFDPQREGSWTYWGYQDTETVELLRSALVEPDPERQEAMYEEVQGELVAQYSAVWLTTFPDVIVASEEVKDLQINELNRAFDYYRAHK